MKEANLSHEGDAWIYEDAQVSGDAWVFGNAQVSGNARVFDDVWVSGNARVSGDALVSGNARVFGSAQVSGDAWVSGDTLVSGDAQVYGHANICHNMRVPNKDNLWVIQASQDVITATPELIAIGCEVHTPVYWLQHYEDIGKAYGYTEKQIHEYGCLLSLFKNCKSP